MQTLEDLGDPFGSLGRVKDSLLFSFVMIATAVLVTYVFPMNPWVSLGSLQSLIWWMITWSWRSGQMACLDGYSEGSGITLESWRIFPCSSLMFVLTWFVIYFSVTLLIFGKDPFHCLCRRTKMKRS